MKTRNTTKIAGILMTLVMLITMLGLLAPTVSAADDITVTIDTNASVTLKDSDSDGYYEISSADELYAFAAIVNGGNANINAELMADITVNENVIVGGSLAGDTSTFRVWTPIGNDSQSYTGIFHGNNKKISGLYYKNADVSYIGLFGYNEGTISGVGVEASYIGAKNMIGGIAGLNTGTISSCYCSGSYICSFNDGSAQIGGIAGNNYSKNSTTATIEKCYNTSTIKAAGYRVAGIAGMNQYGYITDCYNTGNISSNSDSNYPNVAGIVGSTYGNITNCYNAGSITSNGAAGIAASLSHGGYVKNCYNNKNVFTSSYYDGLVREITSSSSSLISSASVTAEDLSSGRIAYLLNDGRTPAVWGQTVGTDGTPVLGVTASNTIYKNGICSDVKYENTAGTFLHDAAMVASEHYSADGVCKLCGTQAVASLTTAGATPTVSYYATLADAIKATKTNGGATITVLHDIVLTEAIAVNEDDSSVTFEFVLDLNGKTLYNPTGGVFAISSQYGSLVKMGLTDSSDAKSGRIVGSGSVITVSARGSLTIDTVTIATGTVDAGGNLIPTTIGYAIESVDGVNSWNDRFSVKISSGNFIGTVEASAQGVTGGSFTRLYSGNLADDYFGYDANGNLVTYLSDTTITDITVKRGADLAHINVTIPNTYTYRGIPYATDATVKLSNQYLVEGEDYTTTYTNNDKVGTATITFTGMGAFYGTYTKEVEILKGTLIVEAGPTATHEYGDAHANHPISGKVVAQYNETMEIPGTWSWVSGTTKAIFTPDAAYVDSFNSLGERDVTVTVTVATPILTITSPSPAIMPGQSIQMGIEIKNPHNASLTDLPDTFTLSYQTAKGGTATEVNGLNFTLPSDTVIGSTVYVTVKSAAVSGKYAAGTSNTVEITVGQVDYSKDINDLQEQLDKLDDIYATDAEAQDKIDAIQNQIDQLDSTYATDADITDIQTQIDHLTATLATKAELEAAKNALQDAIDKKADSATLVEEVNKLTAAIEAAKTFATDQDADLKAAIEAADGVLMKAIDQVQKNLEEAEDRLQDAIDKKADSATLVEEVNKLSAAIEAAKTFATDQDAELKAAIESADGVLMKAIDQVQKNLDDAKNVLNQAILDGDRALDQKITNLNQALQAAKAALEAADKANREALEQKIAEAKSTLTASIRRVEQKLSDTKDALNDAIKTGDNTLDKKITALNEALAAAKAALEAADDANKSELTAKIEEAYATLDTAIKTVQKNLDDVKGQLEKADADNKAALEAKDAELQTFIIVVCVISGVALCGSGAFVVWFFVDRKKRI